MITYFTFSVFIFIIYFNVALQIYVWQFDILFSM